MGKPISTRGKETCALEALLPVPGRGAKLGHAIFFLILFAVVCGGPGEGLMKDVGPASTVHKDGGGNRRHGHGHDSQGLTALS